MRKKQNNGDGAKVSKPVLSTSSATNWLCGFGQVFKYLFQALRGKKNNSNLTYLKFMRFLGSHINGITNHQNMCDNYYY